MREELKRYLEKPLAGIRNVLSRSSVDRLWILWWPVALALVGYSTVLLHRSIVATEQSLPRIRAERMLVSEQAAEARQLMTSGNRQSLDALVAKQAVLDSLRNAQLDKDLGTLDAGAPGELSISFPAVKFDAWVQWVEALFNGSAIVLSNCHLALVSPGVVKVDAKLSYSSQ